MFELVGDTSGVGKVEGVCIEHQQIACAELVVDVSVERSPQVVLMALDAEEQLNLRSRKFEELPLIEVEPAAEDPSAGSERLTAQGVKEFHPGVNGAVRFGPHSGIAVNTMGAEGVEIGKELGFRHGWFNDVALRETKSLPEFESPSIWVDPVLVAQRNRNSLKAEPNA